MICILLVIVGVGIVKLRQPAQKSQDNPSSLSYPTSQIVTFKVEGQTEQITLQAVESDSGRLVLYIDTSRYEALPKDELLVITPITPMSDVRPVRMTVTYENEQAMAVIKKHTEQATVHFDTITPIQNVSFNQYEGLEVIATDRDTKLTDHIIVIPRKDHGSYRITMELTAHTSEGHGARLLQMAKTITIVK